MAEQLAELNKGDTNIHTFSFNVTSISAGTALGALYQSADQLYDTGMNLTGKKIFVTFVQSNVYPGWPGAVKIVDNTKVGIIYVRASSGTIDGKLNVIVMD